MLNIEDPLFVHKNKYLGAEFKIKRSIKRKKMFS